MNGITSCCLSRLFHPCPGGWSWYCRLCWDCLPPSWYCRCCHCLFSSGCRYFFPKLSLCPMSTLPSWFVHTLPLLSALWWVSVSLWKFLAFLHYFLLPSSIIACFHFLSEIFLCLLYHLLSFSLEIYLDQSHLKWVLKLYKLLIYLLSGFSFCQDFDWPPILFALLVSNSWRHLLCLENHYCHL